MQYFTNDYLNFFKELASNNNKAWFDNNRKRYEYIVREPFKLFISDLIEEVAKQDSEVKIEPKDAIFRINRYIRFSKDKTPYKLNNSAIISKMGRKDKSYPGLYIESGPEKLGIYGGVYMPDTLQVKKIRHHIINNKEEFKKIINNKIFKQKFDEIQGEKHKRLYKEFLEAAKDQPLLFNKQWYHFAYLSASIITSNNLIDTILEYNKAALPLKYFLADALSS